MRIKVTTTAEFDGPAAAVRSVLADPAAWTSMLPQAERLGCYWRYAGELYEIHVEERAECLTWRITGVASPGVELLIEACWRDMIIVTSVTVGVTLVVPSTPAALLRRGTLRRRVTEACRRALKSCREQLQPRASNLAEHYPRTIAAFETMGALEHLERIARLDTAWSTIRQGTTHIQPDDVYIQSPLPNPHSPSDYDLIYAGGGLGLLHAAVMARRYGYRVLLFDRDEVGCAHREWNISRAELDALIAVGFCTWDEIRNVIMAEYDSGVVRFHDAAHPTELWMRDVLNVALDAGALLRLARRKLTDAGATVLDQRVFRRVVVSECGPARVLVALKRTNGVEEWYAGRLLLDGMGSSSPLALRRFGGQPFAAVCPTVGTVAAGFAAGDAPDSHNPHVGDILISVADAQRGQQYMWEGFPGRDDELTVYLFYYDTLTAPDTETRRHGDTETQRHGAELSPGLPVNLMQLFEDYFALLPTYKRPSDTFRQIKPVYGYIPARHSVQQQEAALLRGVLPIGDSAAQQSPLTFCGFGSHVRNLDRTTALLHHALHSNLTEPHHLRSISAYQVNASLNWVFSRFMQPWDAPGDVNALQNVFLRVLNDLGEELARRFFRDQMRWGDYHRMILGMFRRHPRIALIAWRVLGPAGIRRWIASYLTYSRAGLAAWFGRRIGASGRAALVAALDRCAPALGLWLRAQFAEWQAMGWV